MKEEIIQQEFQAMLNRCNGILFKICQIHAGRSRDCVNDLYQEVVCNLWRGYRHFRDESKETTWVWRVATNTAVDQYRRRRRELPQVEMSAELYDNLAEAPPDEQLERLYELIGLLDSRERELADLYLVGVPIREMAVVLNCTEAVVNKRIYRLKQRLKELNETVD